MAEQPIAYLDRDRRTDRSLFLGALAVAVLVHVLVLLLQLPERRSFVGETPPDREPPHVVQTWLPPPPVERTAVERHVTEHRRPVPGPVPEPPEPLAETPAIHLDFTTDETEILIDRPEPPEETALRVPGLHGVTEPLIIEETRIAPEYPAAGRLARAGAVVLLQAVIRADGSVGDVVVLGCDRESLGFEEAAARAVRMWRYHPAMQDGRPVDVYFTIRVTFELR